MLNQPRLSDLQLFCLVAKHASFIAAAKLTGAPQTTVSKRISALEEALGVTLFHRTTRTVNITEDGLKVYQWAEKIIDSFHELRDELTEGRSEPRGSIRISAASRLGRDYVAPALSRMKRQFPGIDVWLEIVNKRVDLHEERFHLDIRTGDTDEPQHISHKLFDSSRIICVAPDYLTRFGEPATLAELARHQCILFRDRDEPFGTWRLKGPRGWDSVNVHGDFASNDNDVVLSWAHAGHGFRIGTDWFLADSLRNKQLVRVLPDWHQPADVRAISVMRTNQSAKVRLCIEFLKEELMRSASEKVKSLTESGRA